METAKVDIRKLQLLNDRISQTIDALNQVRMSVHGLSHASPLGQLGVGYPQLAGQPFAGQTFGYPQVPQFQTAVGMASPWGLGHTSPVVDPLSAMRYAQAAQAQLQAAQLQAAQLAAISPWLGGLSHSSPEILDPFLTARYVQTFPYALTPIPVS